MVPSGVRALWISLLAVVLTAGVARAGDRLVLVAPPPALTHAVADQLAPWQIDVIVDGEPIPTSDDAARVVAGRFHARAVAWIDGAQLVVFERRTGMARRPAAVPLDGARAAALALSLKTILRESGWSAPPPPPPPVTVGASIAAGVRLRGAGAEPRVTLGIDTRIAALHAGVGLRAGLGAGVPAREGSFSGTWVDRAVGLVVTVPGRLGAFDLGAGAGASVHLTQIHGVILTTGVDGRQEITNLGIDAEATALWRHAPVAIGLRAAATWVPWRQRYTVSDQVVFTVSHVEGELGVDVMFEF